VNDPLVSERIQRTVDELDETIREIRSVIFAVESAKRKGSGLRSDLLGVVGDAAPALGFEPTVMFEGAVDALVPEGIADHLLAVTREALSNVARHARATTVRVQLSVTEEIVLEVMDDGRGPFSSGRRGNGLRNMADRAKALGGIAHLEARPDGGSRLEWRIPLHRQAGTDT
jgi:signal transduction histidine kinase